MPGGRVMWAPLVLPETHAPLCVLALDPYYGGSHRAMLDAWQRFSRHQIEIVGLPARHWKWRMRHGGLTLAQQADQRVRDLGLLPDVVVASSMLDLPQWRGSVSTELAQLPAIVYFHENQLTHPVSKHQRPDLHYGFTNVLTAIAADATWFNSSYHLDTFFTAADAFLKRMPDYQHREDLAAAQRRATVIYPGIEAAASHFEVTRPLPSSGTESIARQQPKPVHLGWIARWESDKRPEKFLGVLRGLKKTGRPFRLTVLARPTTTTQRLWADLQTEFRDEIVFAGYAPSRADYHRRVAAMDGVISTTAHEFFGIAIAEAASHGVIPIVPQGLAYPELHDGAPDGAFFHDGSVASILACVDQLVALRQQEAAWQQRRRDCAEKVSPLHWPRQVQQFDRRLELLARK